MSDSDDEERQMANVAAWVNDQYKAMIKSDLKPWVVENDLHRPSLEQGCDWNRDVPWQYTNFQTHTTHEASGPMHTSNQMQTTERPHYMVENSFLVRQCAVDETYTRWEFRLVGVKVLCKLTTVVEEVKGKRVTRDAWIPFSYKNGWDKQDGNDRLWVHYPTGETSEILDYAIDTRTNHRAAVQAAMDAGQLLDFLICVMRVDALGRATVAKHVYSKARIVNAWREVGSATRPVALYQIQVCPGEFEK